MSNILKAIPDKGLDRSTELFARAQETIPGGVNSPVRAFGGVGGTPVFVDRAAGCRFWDVDGNEYIDFVGSWGPLILGHAHPKVIEAVQKAAERGTSYGCSTLLEIELAELVCSAVGSVERVRMVSSGTEAAMSALRLARGATGRNKIVKIAGCYHGHVDSLLVQAGSGVATLGLPDSPGVTPGASADTLTIPYNDLTAAQEVFDAQGSEIAALIVEPIAGNMGMVPPVEGYLAGLRAITRKAGSLLILDEIITGFRIGLGGAQTLYGVEPDLTLFGKIIGGGLPVGAYGGRAEIMRQVAPEGPVYQAGTLSGNPLAMTAGLTTLRILRDEGVYEKLERLSASLAAGLGAAAKDAGMEVFQTRVGSMNGLFFQEGPVADYESAKRSDGKRYARFFHGMLAEGFYFAPSQFETAFVCAAHDDEAIERTIEAARRVMKQI